MLQTASGMSKFRGINIPFVVEIQSAIVTLLSIATVRYRHYSSEDICLLCENIN